MYVPLAVDMEGGGGTRCGGTTRADGGTTRAGWGTLEGRGIAEGAEALGRFSNA